MKLQYIGADGDGLRDGDTVVVMEKVLTKGGDAVDFGKKVDQDVIDRWSDNPHFKVTGVSRTADPEPAA